MTQYKSLHELADQPDDLSPINEAAWNSTPLVLFLQKTGRILAHCYFVVLIFTIQLGRISAHFDHPDAFIGTYWLYTFTPLTCILIIWLVMWPFAWVMARRNFIVKGKANPFDAGLMAKLAWEAGRYQFSVQYLYGISNTRAHQLSGYWYIDRDKLVTHNRSTSIGISYRLSKMSNSKQELQ